MMSAKDDREKIKNGICDMEEAFERFMTRLQIQIKAGQEATHQELVAHRGDHAKSHTQILEGQQEQKSKLSETEEILLLKGLTTAHLANGDIHESCMQGTRVSILEEARTWARDETADQVFWLADVAGAGKSTVANHLAKEWKSQRKLAGRFFFSRDAEETRTPKYFFSTLAQQGLSHLGPQVQSAVTNGIRELRDPVSAPLEEQYRQLLINPLKTITFSVVLVLDALDECEPSALGRLLRIILKELPKIPYLKLFITSRPENHITESLEGHQVHRVSLRHNVESNRNDVWTFIREKLRSISLPDDKIDKLVARSEGLFIWATTVCRLLLKFRGDRDQFLADVLVQGPHQMNSIYKVALQQALPSSDEIENVKIYQRVLSTIVVAFEPLSPNAINKLLRINNTLEVVKDLQSVLDCPDADALVRFLHPTFRDFLLQSIDNHPCHVEEESSHINMVQACLEIMADDLRWDLCGLFHHPLERKDWYGDISSAAQKDSRTQFQSRLQQCTTYGLRYSCLFWGQHFNACNTVEVVMDQILLLRLDHFFRHNLLDWMYLLSLLHSTGHPWILLRRLLLARMVNAYSI
ncbi:hypothetical protein CPB86DRAFT_849000 [Serendipita vermifera]|nr:hypothetical protein CPB86DRAFT_849000 [Serendipita vermifera]